MNIGCEIGLKCFSKGLVMVTLYSMSLHDILTFTCFCDNGISMCYENNFKPISSSQATARLFIIYLLL